MIHRIAPITLALLSLSTAAVAAPKAAKSSKTARIESAPHRAPPSLSVGSPTSGHLVGGAHLMESPAVRIVPFYAPGDARWGLEALVGMIDRSAKVVKKQFPDAVLSVGHLSRSGGGDLDRHASHESGRDADIGFYVKNQQGKSIFSDHYVPFKGDGTAPTWPGAQFDDAKNWSLVSSIASDAQARVTHIFVATPLRQRLLAYAEKIGAPPALRTRAAEVMAQPHGALPHDDHFHVRIGCPAGMDKCVELPLPKRHPHSAIAHAGSHKPTPHAPPAGRAPTTAPPVHAKAAPPPPAKPKDDDSLIPSLAPMVPGLDAAIIGVPLANVPGKIEPKDAEPDFAPIDDPDGVLEKH